jgi:hypothetical protein
MRQTPGAYKYGNSQIHRNQLRNKTVGVAIRLAKIATCGILVTMNTLNYPLPLRGAEPHGSLNTRLDTLLARGDLEHIRRHLLLAGDGTQQDAARQKLLVIKNRYCHWEAEVLPSFIANRCPRCNRRRTPIHD